MIGSELRDERHRQGRTLVDVADRAWVSVTHLSDVERGHKEASSEVLESICRSLEVDVADVLEGAARRLRLGDRPSGGGVLMLAA